MKFRDHRKHGKYQRGGGKDENDINTIIPYKFLRVYIIQKSQNSGGVLERQKKWEENINFSIRSK